MHHFSDYKLAWIAFWVALGVTLYACGAWFFFTTSTRRGERVKARLDNWRYQRRNARFERTTSRLTHKALAGPRQGPLQKLRELRHDKKVANKLADELGETLGHPAQDHHTA